MYSRLLDSAPRGETNGGVEGNRYTRITHTVEGAHHLLFTIVDTMITLYVSVSVCVWESGGIYIYNTYIYIVGYGDEDWEQGGRV